MPRQGSSKKRAAQTWGKLKAMEAATKEGKYIIAKVEKAIGFCQFTAKAELPNGQVRDVTVLVRGKFKGGKTCVTRIESGCYVMVEGDLSKTLEIVGVVNTHNDVEKLKRSGRIAKLVDEDDLDEFFDRSGEDSDAGEKLIGTMEDEDGPASALIKKRKERATDEGSKNAADELVSRYRMKMRVKDDVTRGDIIAEAKEDAEGLGFADPYEYPDGDATAAATPLKKKKAAVPAPLVAPGASTEDLEEALDRAHKRGLYQEENYNDMHSYEVFQKKTPANWEDDIDIDAI